MLLESIYHPTHALCDTPFMTYQQHIGRSGTYIVLLIIQDFSLIVHITAGVFLGLCDEKSSYKHVSDFGRLRSYDRLKLRIEDNDY